MNALAQALKDAGVSVPAPKRIWLWLNDHPGATYIQIAKALGIAPNTVSSQLNALECRNMVARVKEKDVRRNFMVSRWHTTIVSYEVLPMKKNGTKIKPTSRRNDTVTLTPPPFSTGTTIVQPTPTTVTKVDLLEQMNVKDAYALYVELSKMFGGRHEPV